MGKIIRLDTHLSNMIAAGEVVERPSSVVKELVENSIDANANIIAIHLTDSGIKEINVIDNGFGMGEEDALLAFSRHATSKIKNEYDLSRIHTLGFRGEAMPSIASVSNMRLLTNNAETNGFEVIYKAGSYYSSGPKACNLGTNIIVKDLFFNTPARLKYLKSLSSELSSSVYLVGRFALSKPSISFTITNNGKEIIKTSGNNDVVRLFGELYGLEVAKNLFLKEYSGYGYKFKLILVKPQISRTTKNEITVITNGRFVKSIVISNAIIEGYKTYLPIGKYPIVCLYLDIDPLLIDVNVHPSKMQIKISNEDEISTIITKLVTQSLNEVNNVYNAKMEEISQSPLESYKKESIFTIPKMMPLDVKPSYETRVEISQKTQRIIQEEPIIYEHQEDILEAKFPYLEYIGAMHGTYLLFQNEEGLHLIDQHAAAERIRYEYYYELLNKPKMISEALLIPYNLEFTKEEMIFLEDNFNRFKEIGFLLELSGSNSYFVREVPVWVKMEEMEDIVRKVITMMINSRSVDIMRFRDSIAKQISCKSSIKANKSLSMIEINSLMADLAKCNNPYNCPHGRPTIVKVSSYEIEKLFKRVT